MQQQWSSGLKKRILAQAEAEKLRQLQAGLDPSSGGVDSSADLGQSEVNGQGTDEDPAAIDARSIYVGNASVTTE